MYFIECDENGHSDRKPGLGWILFRYGRYEFNDNKGNNDGLEKRCKNCRKQIHMNNKITNENIETSISKICPQCKEDKLTIKILIEKIS